MSCGSMMLTSLHLHFIFLFIMLGFPYYETIRLCSCNTDVNVRCIDGEREALLDLKHGFTDPSGRLSAWHGEDCCTWTGVSCSNKTRHVTRLDLGNAFPRDDDLGLRGQISPSLVQLKGLLYLNLSYNNFNTPIPTFIGSLPKLMNLDLYDSCFKGTVPPHLGNLSNLRLLHLGGSSWSCDNGDLEVDNLHWLSRLSSLKYLKIVEVNLNASATDWLHDINMLPSLLELTLKYCALPSFPLSLPFLNLTSLRVLDLGGNSIYSSIPHWFSGLTHLSTLDLSGNHFTGPIGDTFTNFTSLKVLDLSRNNFNSSIPQSISSLCTLETLDLSDNKFQGEITKLIDGLAACSPNNLRYLNLAHNLFSGTIPKSLGTFSQLEAIDVSHNRWEGVISEAHFSNLKLLKQLVLGSHRCIPQSLGGCDISIRTNWVPPFSGLTSIVLSTCQLGPLFPSWIQYQKNLSSLRLPSTGITEPIPNWFQNLKFLKLLDLSNNQINSRFPSEIFGQWVSPLEQLYLNNNSLSGELPLNIGEIMPNLTRLDLSMNSLNGQIPSSLCKSTKLHFLNLDSNCLTGGIPDEIGSSNLRYLTLQNNLLSGPIPYNIGEVMPNLDFLDLSNNSINGEIPPSICKIENLTYLYLSSNGLHGELPRCSWMGLEYVDLANNSLTGELPNEIGNLSSLQYLKLSNNDLHGKLPPSLQQLEQLILLDLGENNFSGEIPAWIGMRLPHLIALRLRSNKFTGYIPPQLCRLHSLHILDLGNNKLSGITPLCFGNLSAMALVGGGTIINSFPFVSSRGNIMSLEDPTVMMVKGSEHDYKHHFYNSIDLSCNNLSGKIPKGLTRLLGLGILNLSMNHLTGVIPEQIGLLQQLEVLDLSRNKLSGTIPQGMSNLTFLSHLNLSYNNFFGRIVVSHQMETLNISAIYEGNPQLCGLPLVNKCPGDGVIPSPNSSIGNDEGSNDTMWLCISVATGFIIGFWGVCSSLLLSQSWRRAYFQFIVDMKDKLLVVIAIRITHLRSVFSKTA